MLSPGPGDSNRIMISHKPKKKRGKREVLSLVLDESHTPSAYLSTPEDLKNDPYPSAKSTKKRIRKRKAIAATKRQSGATTVLTSLRKTCTCFGEATSPSHTNIYIYTQRARKRHHNHKTTREGGGAVKGSGWPGLEEP